MTVVTDNKKRVTLRAKVRIEKRGPYSVGVLDRPISEQAIEEAMREFP